MRVLPSVQGSVPLLGMALDVGPMLNLGRPCPHHAQVTFNMQRHQVGGNSLAIGLFH